LELADQLSSLLSELDTAIRTRVQTPGRRETREPLEPLERPHGLLGTVVSTLRRLTGSEEPEPTSRRIRSRR
jgi:hypothetical protein